MGQNKIYKNKHPSDFTKGSIIRQLSNDNNGKGFLYCVCDRDGVRAGIYAVGLNSIRAGSTWISNTKHDFELIKGSLKE